MASSLPKQKEHLPLPVYFLIFLGFHKLVQIAQISVSSAFSPLADYIWPLPERPQVFCRVQILWSEVTVLLYR